MNTARASRPIPLALTVLVAFFAALTALAVTNGHDAHAHGNAPASSGGEAALRSDLRVLWEDHIVWTRLAIISLTTGSPDTSAARLEGRWAADVAAYDRSHHHILHLSDLLADGLIQQVPKQSR